MQRISTRSSHGVGDKPRRPSEVGGVVVRGHSIFFDGVGGNESGWPGDEQVVVIDTVQKKIRAADALTIHGKTKPSICGVVGAHSGLEYQERIYITSCERQ